LTIRGVPAEPVTMWYVKPVFMTRAAVLMSAELVIRAWLEKPVARWQRHFCEALFVTSMILIPATTTYERESIRWVTPFYVAAALLSARQIAGMSMGGNNRERGERLRLASMKAEFLRTLLALAVLGVGFLSVSAITEFSGEMSSWAVQMLQGKFHRTGAATEIGLSTTPILRGVFNPIPSMERAMMLEGIQGERHVRFASYDQYENGQWQPAINERRFLPLNLRDLRPGSATVPTHLVRVVPLGPNGSEYLGIPAGAMTLSPDVAVESDEAGTVRSIRGEHAGQWTVDLAEGDDATTPLLVPAPTSRPTTRTPQMARLLEVPPEVEPGVLELARQVASGEGPATRTAEESDRTSRGPATRSGPPAAADETLTAPADAVASATTRHAIVESRQHNAALLKVYRIANYLRTHNSYSLQYIPSEKRDPVSEFVLERRSAHCQYFASAMVIMARAAGVPARYVTGYYAHEPATAMSPDGSETLPATLIRERDAHAWAECYVEGAGWIVVDATPSSGRPDALNAPPSAWRRFWESVVDFPSVAREWLARGGLTRILLMSGGGVVVILLGRAVFLRWMERRRLIALSRRNGLDPRLVEVASRFERELVRLRLPVKGTWRERLRSSPVMGIAGEFLETYEVARFGQDASAIGRAQELLGDFVSAVEKSAIGDDKASSGQ
jgi:transglutaminase-like putative cysteine protease